VIEQSDKFDRRVARIEPWGAGDLPLLVKLNDPEMTKHLGGPESPEKLTERQSRYEKADSRQYKVVVDPSDQGVGWVGYWEQSWRDQPVWEIGWAVIPSFQGRGIASSATAQLIDRARAEQQHPFVHAFPSGRERAVKRHLPQARLHVARRDRLPSPPGRLRAVQRLALRPRREQVGGRKERPARYVPTPPFDRNGGEPELADGLSQIAPAFRSVRTRGRAAKYAGDQSADTRTGRRLGSLWRAVIIESLVLIVTTDIREEED
jgi:GNAT superfamily N-acetyltransferase